MQSLQAKNQFVAMLHAAEFDAANPVLQTAWSVFKAFVQIPIDGADEGILFQCGDYGSAQFNLGFERQLTFEINGEYSHMEEIHCNFNCPTDDILRDLHETIWSFDFPTLDDFFVAVENMNAFRTALSHPIVWKCEIGAGGI